MSLHPDLSDSQLLAAFDDVRNESSSTNWVLFGYVPKTDKIKVDSTGTGGFAEMTDNMSDGKVHYGFIRYNMNGTWKFVYIAWCGDGVTGIRKGSFASHAVDMGRFLEGFHVQVNARNEDDLDEPKILARLKTATASHGRRNEKAKVQGTTGVDTTPSRQAPAKRDVGDDIKAESAAFWEKQRAEEAEEKRRAEESGRNRNAPAPSQGGRSVGRQWEQKQQDASAQPPPARAAPPSGGAARIAASFNNPPPAQAPPPKVSAPPPKPVAAPPPPEPVYEDPTPAPEESYGGAEESYGGAEESYGGAEESYGGEEQHYGGEEAAPEESYGGEESYNAGGEEHYGGEEAAPEESYGGEEQYGGGDAAASAQCKALYDYQGENEGDLTFNEGDIIALLDQSNPDGWWEGEVNGQRGFFPSNFVSVI